uniref:ADAM metallopeptidase with thrombospondin type 1 motif 18 n=1 Tax=Molossus molossus TaxID=27622 RepID=A0A7J8C587_MOLMO|nr:ADAM metallopeptidase with thrombospondin type 1 motif 18 [Molossus molossus]
MECALLLACALPAAGAGPPWAPAGLGRVAKALQLCCLCCASVAAALASDSNSGGSGLKDDYVFVTPVEVDAGGSYISHDISHSGRRKRSAQSASSSLHYRFSAFGQELHLELKPSAILSGQFIVHVLGKDGASETWGPRVQRCFYQGFIRNDSSSSVAVSTCAGLSGLIRTQKNEFLISPLPQLLAQEHNYSSPAGHHPHVLYKRTAEETVQRYHGYPGSSQNHPGQTPAHAPHTYWSQGREHPHQRLQKQHFCGRRKKCICPQASHRGHLSQV